jgi:hypothetical protein
MKIELKETNILQICKGKQRVTERKGSGEEVSVFVATSGLFIYVPMRLQHFSQHMNQSLPWAKTEMEVYISYFLILSSGK